MWKRNDDNRQATTNSIEDLHREIGESVAKAKAARVHAVLIERAQIGSRLVRANPRHDGAGIVSDREFGCVTYWNSDRGFGFVKPDDGFGDNRFVHFSQIRRTGLSELSRGQRVSCELGPDRNGRAMAVNVELVGS
jgi:CspA family cold shock protein